MGRKDGGQKEIRQEGERDRGKEFEKVRRTEGAPVKCAALSRE